jgi:hypothetical protein
MGRAGEGAETHHAWQRERVSRGAARRKHTVRAFVDAVGLIDRMPGQLIVRQHSKGRSGPPAALAPQRALPLRAQPKEKPCQPPAPALACLGTAGWAPQPFQVVGQEARTHRAAQHSAP